MRTSDGKKARANAVSAADFKEGRDLTQETMVKRGGAAVAEDDDAAILRSLLNFHNRHDAEIGKQRPRGGECK